MLPMYVWAGLDACGGDGCPPLTLKPCAAITLDEMRLGPFGVCAPVNYSWHLVLRLHHRVVDAQANHPH